MWCTQDCICCHSSSVTVLGWFLSPPTFCVASCLIVVHDFCVFYLPLLSFLSLWLRFYSFTGSSLTQHGTRFYYIQLAFFCLKLFKSLCFVGTCVLPSLNTKLTSHCELQIQCLLLLQSLSEKPTSFYFQEKVAFGSLPLTCLRPVCLSFWLWHEFENLKLFNILLWLKQCRNSKRMQCLW